MARYSKKFPDFRPEVLEVFEISGHLDYARVVIATSPLGYHVRIICHDGAIHTQRAAERCQADAYAKAVVDTASDEIAAITA